MKSTKIKQIWNEFWASDETPNERKHVWAKPASLIVNNTDDPTTMFNSAGMQPLVPYLMGKEHPTGAKRLYNIQGCVRTVDIDEVGDRSHLTYFEMMGNWSLGDYFKEESIAWSWKFLTEFLELDTEKLAVTVFEGDDNAPRDKESANIWKKQGVPEDRITYLPKSENWWGPAGQTGPCGPDTEIFYRVGEGDTPDPASNPGNDEDNWLEIWNNVFMAYYKDKDGNYTELEDKNVDTGMGFERIAMVLQGVTSVYDTDIFRPVLKVLDRYVENGGNDEAKRIIADHIRTAMMLVQEGLIPSNEGRGYVLRRIIRRMYFQRKVHLAGSLEDFEEVIYHIKEHFNELYDGRFTNETVITIFQECEQFAKTIHEGESIVKEMIAEEIGDNAADSSSDEHGDWVLPGKKAFKLYDTYGFPVELTQEIVNKAGGSVDMKGFEKSMKEAKERSRAGSSQKFEKGTDWATIIDDIDETEFLGYETLEEDGVRLLKDSFVGDQRFIITDRTPFYAESGGQTGDTGWIEMDDGTVLQVTDVIKYGGVWIHMVE